MVHNSRVRSCYFCRSRKLRCNRQFPCFNCTTRGLHCPAPPAQSLPPSSNSSVVDHPVIKHSPGSEGDDKALGRLQKLEALISSLAENQPKPGHASMTSPDSISFDALDLHRHLPSKLQGLIEDAIFMDRSCFWAQAKNPSETSGIPVRSYPIRLISQLPSYLDQKYPSASQFYPKQGVDVTWLPTRHEAEILIDEYITLLSPLNPVIHGPTLRALAAECYAALDSGASHLPPGHILLLLSVFARVVLSWESDQDSFKLSCSLKVADAQAQSWSDRALEIADYCQRTSETTLECLQGLVLLVVITLNAETISSKVFSLLNRAIVMARELGLHRIDHPHSRMRSEEHSQFTSVEAETARRIWWHLAAMDWMLSTCPGPQRGTYNIQPNHMVVRKPLNVNDEDVVNDQPWSARPDEETTIMSFFLRRLNLAEELRALVDQTPLVGLDPHALGYSRVLKFDATISRFLQDSASFLTSPASNNVPLSASALQLQRHFLFLLMHGQRCRLHLPYMARATVEPAYMYSPKAALESAKLIIKAERNRELGMQNNGSCKAFKQSVVVTSFLLAVTVLVFDLCLRSEQEKQDAKTQTHEAALAWAMLQDISVHSPMIHRGMGALRKMMRKHEVFLPTDAEVAESPSTADDEQEEAMETATESQFSPESAVTQQDMASLDDLSTMQQYTGNVDWDGLQRILDVSVLF